MKRTRTILTTIAVIGFPVLVLSQKFFLFLVIVVLVPLSNVVVPVGSIVPTVSNLFHNLFRVFAVL